MLLARAASLCRTRNNASATNGGIAVIASMPDLFVVESLVVLIRRVFQRVMIRMISLNQNSSGQVAASSASGHLSD